MGSYLLFEDNSLRTHFMGGFNKVCFGIQKIMKGKIKPEVTENPTVNLP
jgi:hypothetical protein